MCILFTEATRLFLSGWVPAAHVALHIHRPSTPLWEFSGSKEKVSRLQTETVEEEWSPWLSDRSPGPRLRESLVYHFLRLTNPSLGCSSNGIHSRLWPLRNNRRVAPPPGLCHTHIAKLSDKILIYCKFNLYSPLENGKLSCIYPLFRF